MRDKNYYFLRGINKNGPFTEAEIISLSLSPETLIYYDGLVNWTPLKEISELNKYSFLTKKESDTIDENSLSKKMEQKRTITIPKNKVSFYYLIPILIFSTFLCFLYTGYLKDQDFKEIQNDIDQRMYSSRKIFSYDSRTVRGKLIDESENMYLNGNGKRISKMYQCDEDRGWTIYTLEKVGNYFEVMKGQSNSLFLRYPEPLFETKNNQYFTIDNFSEESQYNIIKELYNSSLQGMINKYNVVGNETFHVDPTNDGIKTFSKIKNDFYFISDKIDSLELIKAPEDRTQKNEKCIMNYKVSYDHYKLEEKQNEFKEKWKKYSIITGLISFIIFFVFKYFLYSKLFTKQ